MTSLLAASQYATTLPVPPPPPSSRYEGHDSTTVTQTLSSVRYSTPLYSQDSLRNSYAVSDHGHSSLHTDPEMYALRNMLSVQRPPYPGNRAVTARRSSQMNNRMAYVEALVDTNALLIETIWYASTPQYTRAAVVPLRTFIQEVLKRSRTTYSTLQTALFYLFRSRPAILAHLHQKSTDVQRWEDAYIGCGRRMFLASLVVASKFVQDKTYRNSAWAKIAGLPVAEINAAERIFLELIDYRLYIAQPTFEQWHHLLHIHVEAKTQNQPTTLHDLSLPFTSQSGTSNGWSVVMSSSSPLSHNSQQKQCRSRKRRLDADERQYVLSPLPSCSPASACTSTCSPTSNCSSTNSHIPLPVLSLSSLPNSNSSSPVQTPTQISPVRMPNASSTFTWKVASPAGFQHHDVYLKKRKIESDISYGYTISNVRQSKCKQSRARH
ncbi:hypothetical protein DFQ28_010586 [Apophysomyces sp. BC1034]|nr:hypothetical protein DFQ30_011450 [Apophysomyces sp. BC1015]KAG0183495.1 hypothetical protein DFQ29_002549 [Apophysomyces sp. BC1021]KAG0194502.1 hypothetical protein DFQ28_010586 [Apophysomyces sp. BC1034]